MRLKLISLLINFTIFLNIGCATIINGSTEAIEIQVDRPHSKVSINGVLVGVSEEGQLLKAEIPKKGEMLITVENEFCKPENYYVERKIDPVTFLGILIDGGIFSILVVDIFGTNAFMKADKTNFNFSLHCPTLTQNL